MQLVLFRDRLCALPSFRVRNAAIWRIFFIGFANSQQNQPTSKAVGN
jgi:hypothetical protein